MNISRISKQSASHIWHNIYGSLTQIQPNLGDDIVTAIQQTVLENFTPLIEENFDLKQQLMFSAKEDSATNMKNGKQSQLNEIYFLIVTKHMVLMRL